MAPQSLHLRRSPSQTQQRRQTIQKCGGAGSNVLGIICYPAGLTRVNWSAQKWEGSKSFQFIREKKNLKLSSTFSPSLKDLHFFFKFSSLFPARFSVLIWEVQLTKMKPFWKVRGNDFIQKPTKYLLYQWQFNKKNIFNL